MLDLKPTLAMAICTQAKGRCVQSFHRTNGEVICAVTLSPTSRSKASTRPILRVPAGPPHWVATHLAYASPPSGYGFGHHNHNDHDKLGAVSSENAICSNIGLNTLRKGGNAADSLIATNLCVGVVAPWHSGIAGGGFMLVRSSSGAYEFVDFRETAPAASFQDMYNNNTNASLVTGLASGVPGELKGLQHLYEKYASKRLSWYDLVMPAVEVARDGYPVGADMVRYMATATAGIENFLVINPSYAIDFAPNGTLLGLGDTITRKRYAATLHTIAEQGVGAFYTGPIAVSNGGIMTLADLKNYSVAIRRPGQISYRDFKIHSTTAPSSGSVVLAVMKVIEGYKKIGQAATINESTHLFDEALRFAYGQRALLADPGFNSSIDA
nr:gamma-glutamyltransferase [Quercus suber]